MKKNSLLYLCTFMAVSTFANEYETSFNYFGNVMASKINKEGYTLNHYNHSNVDDQLSFSPYSKLGGQVSIYDSQYKFTTQAIGYRNHDEYKAKITWLNLNYDYDENLAFRAGRMQSNLLINADSLHIDYIHTMAHTPDELYRIIAVEHYDGVEITYKNFINDTFDYTLSIAPYGKSDQKINTTYNSQERIKLKDINAIRLNITNDDDIEIQTSYAKLKSTLDDSSALKSIVNGLEAYGNDMSSYGYENKTTQIFTLGLNYNYEEFRFNSEIMRYETESMNPDTTAYYMMLGYVYNEFTPYIAYSESKNDKEHFDTSNINAPDATSQSLKTSLDDLLYLTNYSQKTKSIGLRYDIKPGLAFKTQIDEVKTINYGSISSSTVTSSGYERRGILGRFTGTKDQTVYIYTMGLSFAF